MKKLIIALSLVLVYGLPWAAPGKISYEKASALYDQLKQPFYDTGLFYKKSFQERSQYMRAGKALEKQFEVFGTGSKCLGAAIMRNEYIQAMHNYANVLEGRVKLAQWGDLTNPMYNAFTYGEQVANCYSDVEALDTKRK